MVKIGRLKLTKEFIVKVYNLSLRLGKGIYLTPHNTYCVRLRRKFAKVNRNFKTLEEAVAYKKDRDMEYLNTLVEKYPLPIDNLNIVKRYVEIFEYSSNICRGA